MTPGTPPDTAPRSGPTPPPSGNARSGRRSAPRPSSWWMASLPCTGASPPTRMCRGCRMCWCAREKRPPMSDQPRSLDDYVDVATRIAEFRDKHPGGYLAPLDSEHPYRVETVTGADRDGNPVTQTFI